MERRLFPGLDKFLSQTPTLLLPRYGCRAREEAVSDVDLQQRSFEVKDAKQQAYLENIVHTAVALATTTSLTPSTALVPSTPPACVHDASVSELVRDSQFFLFLVSPAIVLEHAVVSIGCLVCVLVSCVIWDVTDVVRGLQAGLGMPRDYYTDAQYASQKAAYREYVGQMLSLIEWPEACHNEMIYESCWF